MGEIRKVASIAIILGLIINMVLFAAGKINAIQFWFVIIVTSIIAFVALPKIKS